VIAFEDEKTKISSDCSVDEMVKNIVFETQTELTGEKMLEK
jgi:hypothetical protein